MWKMFINVALSGLDPPFLPLPGTHVPGYTTRPLRGNKQIRLAKLRSVGSAKRQAVCLIFQFTLFYKLSHFADLPQKIVKNSIFHPLRKLHLSFTGPDSRTSWKSET